MELTYNNSTYIIKGTFAIVENVQGDQSLLTVSIGTSATITAHSDSIALGSDNNARTWHIEAARNKQLGQQVKYYIYLLCGRSTKTATLFLSIYRYDIEGYRIDADGHRVGYADDVEYVESNPGDSTSYYIHVGDVSAPVSGKRTVSVDMGMYGTQGGQNQSIYDQVTKAIANAYDTIIGWVQTWVSARFVSLEKTTKQTMVGELEAPKFTAEYVDVEDTITTKNLTASETITSKSASVTQKVSITAGDSSGDMLQLGAALNRGVQGGGAYKDASGNIHFEADYIDVHKKFSAKEVEVQELSYIGGILVLTPADGFKVVKVRRLAANENILDGDSGTAVYYDLLWYAEEDGRTIFNQWKEGDRAMCQVFSSYANENTDIGKYGSGINTKFYWCHVKAADTITIDNVKYNYIRVSYKNGECATGSNPPSVGDSVVMLGHYLSGEDTSTAKARQSAITQAAAGGASPYIRIYEGIGADGSFTMPTAIGTQLKPGANKFTGEVNISGGTIQKADGSTTNFNDFITNMLEAAANGNEALETVSNMKFSLSNLLRNSGFAGDYVSDVVTETSEMSGDESIFSPSMDRWDYDPAMVSAVSNSAVPADDKFDTTSGLGESGMMCRMVGTTASITQVLTWKTTNEKYTFSLYAKRRSEATGNNNIVVSFSNGTSTFDTTITLKSTWDRYNFSFENKAGFTSITISGDAYITQLQLEKNGLSGWGLCVLDNTSEMSMYNALKYLSTQLVNYAVNDGDTYINGGLILSSLIQLGSNNADNTAWECRSGLNGIVVTDNQMDRDTSPAFWAGGDLTAACLLSRYYKDVDISSIEKPSSSLAAQMARAVITHGGRAILRDAVVQGKVYADSGEFRGTVYAQDGEFSGTVKANMMYQKTMQITAQKYVIDPSVEPCTTYYYMPGNENKDYTIILPMAKDYDGLEINVSIFSTLDTPNKYYVRTLYQDDAESLGTSNIDYSDYFLYYKNNASTIDGTIVEKMNVNYSRVHGQKIQMHTSSYFTFKSIGGSWYAIRGLFLSVV